MQNVALLKHTAQIVVAGTEGQVLVLKLSDVPLVNMGWVDLLQDHESVT